MIPPIAYSSLVFVASALFATTQHANAAEIAGVISDQLTQMPIDDVVVHLHEINAAGEVVKHIKSTLTRSGHFSLPFEDNQSISVMLSCRKGAATGQSLYGPFFFPPLTGSGTQQINFPLLSRDVNFAELNRMLHLEQMIRNDAENTFAWNSNWAAHVVFQAAFDTSVNRLTDLNHYYEVITKLRGEHQLTLWASENQVFLLGEKALHRYTLPSDRVKPSLLDNLRSTLEDGASDRNSQLFLNGYIMISDRFYNISSGQMIRFNPFLHDVWARDQVFAGDRLGTSFVAAMSDSYGRKNAIMATSPGFSGEEKPQHEGPLRFMYDNGLAVACVGSPSLRGNRGFRSSSVWFAVDYAGQIHSNLIDGERRFDERDSQRPRRVQVSDGESSVRPVLPTFATFSQDEEFVVVGSGIGDIGNRVSLYRVNGLRSERPFEPWRMISTRSTPLRCDLTADGKYVVVLSNTQTLSVYECDGSKDVLRPVAEYEPVRDFSIVPNSGGLVFRVVGRAHPAFINIETLLDKGSDKSAIGLRTVQGE